MVLPSRIKECTVLHHFNCCSTASKCQQRHKHTDTYTQSHHLKQQTDQLLGLAPVLGGEGGGGHIEEGRPALGGHSLG